MKLHYWKFKGDYAIHISGYQCLLTANLGPDYTWADHIAEKPWAHPGCLAELRAILAARYQGVAA